jgi:hypothetical protein
MLWCKEGGSAAEFTDENVLSDYSAVTGFNPRDPYSDRGTDMQEAASYRRKVGVVDSHGSRHRIDSYVALQTGDLDDLIIATYLFGATGVGIMLPSQAEDKFDNAEIWDVDAHDRVVGGHYISVLGRNSKGNLLLVTWGRLHSMTPEFYKRYNDESVAYLSLERLKNKVSPEGFHIDKLTADLKAVGS